MKTADHIKEIKNAIRSLNKDGHITEVDQYMAMIELKDCVNVLKESFENLEGAISALGKTMKWHENSKNVSTPYYFPNEVSAGEELEESEEENG